MRSTISVDMFGPAHIATWTTGPEPMQPQAPQSRKRSKYIRGRAGCLSCRIKKVKVSLERAEARIGHAKQATRFPSATSANPIACAVTSRRERSIAIIP